MSRDVLNLSLLACLTSGRRTLSQYLLTALEHTAPGCQLSASTPSAGGTACPLLFALTGRGRASVVPSGCALRGCALPPHARRLTSIWSATGEEASRVREERSSRGTLIAFNIKNEAVS
jgi:hypothetical protein